MELSSSSDLLEGYTVFQGNKVIEKFEDSYSIALVILLVGVTMERNYI